MNAQAPTSTTREITITTGMSITVEEFGTNTAADGSAVLYLHGGAGPRTMVGIAAALSEHAYGIVPTHPGFDGTTRPDRFDSIADLAEAYLDLLDALAVTRVLAIGHLIAGWIGAEIAAPGNLGRLSASLIGSASGTLA